MTNYARALFLFLLRVV